MKNLDKNIYNTSLNTYEHSFDLKYINNQPK